MILFFYYGLGLQKYYFFLILKKKFAHMTKYEYFCSLKTNRICI